ncbi:hypothetical protein N0V87_010212 [Didymella glomerata]|uniref:Rhodopsin domain-containing protein n=1 Tax=Didymella glomerata TaxID=749621 RepID=A0A9W9BVM2_9PLEO|nr:hypothetical protein N0V87_010212 [Didymella glomerata]
MAVVVCYTFWTVFSSIFATNAAINISTDFAIIILPMPVIRSLNLDRRQKTALMGIFAVGGL